MPVPPYPASDSETNGTERPEDGARLPRDAKDKMGCDKHRDTPQDARQDQAGRVLFVSRAVQVSWFLDGCIHPAWQAVGKYELEVWVDGAAPHLVSRVVFVLGAFTPFDRTEFDTPWQPR